MGRWMKKLKNKQYGQAMVEFALTIPIFLLLIFGIIELSRFFLVYSSVYTASREASRYGSSVGEEHSENYKNCNEIANRAVASGWFGGIREFNEDPNSNEEVNIFYESTPGNVVGLCERTLITEDDGSVTPTYKLIRCNNSLDDCDSLSTYNPQMGDRVVVDVTTTFRSLLGIVPDMAVHSQNGRTIMMLIVVESTPVPYEKCDDHVSFVNPVAKEYPSDSNALYVEVQNLQGEGFIGTYGTMFLINEISNINWDNSAIKKLTEIKWVDESNTPTGNEVIWKTNILDDENNPIGDVPLINIPGGENYWEENSRPLPPNTSRNLIFIFTDEVSQDELNLSFTLVMQNSSIPTDLCFPVK